MVHTLLQPLAAYLTGLDQIIARYNTITGSVAQYNTDLENLKNTIAPGKMHLANAALCDPVGNPSEETKKWARALKGPYADIKTLEGRAKQLDDDMSAITALAREAFPRINGFREVIPKLKKEGTEADVAEAADMLEERYRTRGDRFVKKRQEVQAEVTQLRRDISTVSGEVSNLIEWVKV
ncbi:hypothetical protein TWF481_000541 [Arthrobotrys musiformis]|uniref:Uncharacterized protein n=1 Tax=Arthrobotrys musiformis TaxID=47236 RepID=A0AAV9WPX7_9PEZI